MLTDKKALIAACAVAASAAGGAAFAGAATNGSASTTAQARDHRGPGPGQRALTGATADKVKAAAEAKVPGGTVLRVESGGPASSAYHAHVRRSDGSEVVVLVNSSFEATSVPTRPARGPGGPGGRHGRETALTGATAAKVKAAAEDTVPGGSVIRTETDADSSSPYEAHVRPSDGTEVVVLVDKDFKATSVQAAPGHP